MTKRILMIVTSNNQMGDSGKPTGLWAEELSVPYFALLDAGCSIDLASPAGGIAPIDPGSVKPAGSNETSVERLLKDPHLQQALAYTRKASEIAIDPYDAIFFPGGHGAMWDLPNDAGVGKLVTEADQRGKLIASVCHGAAGLVGARMTNGDAVVKGKKINSFTDAEEDAVGLSTVVPFKLESRLRELGALFEGTANWQAFVIRDKHFITGQNPQSSKLVANELLTALKLI
jgi:putative intracellular protease/amidase